MSFVDKIPEADRQNYTDVSDWAAHYSSYTAPTVTPSERITLNIYRKIFINNVYFNGTYLFGLKFKNCYFRGEVGFSDLIFKVTSFLIIVFNRKYILVSIQISIQSLEL